MNSQKVIEEMAKQKAPSSRRANPEERGVLSRTPQRRRMQQNTEIGLFCEAIFFEPQQRDART